MNIAELERLAQLAVGEGTANGTSRDQVRHVTIYNPPPLERDIRREIYRVIYNHKDWIDRGEIARQLKLKKTKWLIDHIERLVDEGYLARAETVQANGMKHYWYTVTS